MKKNRICIVGAGAIGCYIGGRLSAAGNDVRFIGRRRTGDLIKAHGLHLNDYAGNQQSLKDVAFFEDMSFAADAEFILVTVKSGSSSEVAAQLSELDLHDNTIISLQNGVRNASIFKKSLPQLQVVPGMVPFNVVMQDEASFHQGTEGQLVFGNFDGDTRLQSLFDATSLTLEIHQQIEAIQWTKLVMNLNNAVNALSGIPLLQQIHSPEYRELMAEVIEEAMLVINRAGIQTRRVGKVIPQTLPFILRLPNFAFKRVARAMLEIDPKARSSMYDDLEQHRTTEIDYLNGEIVSLAEKMDLEAPINSKLVARIKEAEQRGEGSPRLSARGTIS